MRHQLWALPRADKLLLVAVAIIFAGIVLSIMYGLRQTELATLREAAQKQRMQEATERNQLEIGKNKLEAELEITRLKNKTAELSANQAQNNLRDVRAALSFVNQQRVKDQKEHDKKLQGLITTNLDACKRWLAECARAKQLHLRAADAPCECR